MDNIRAGLQYILKIITLITKRYSKNCFSHLFNFLTYQMRWNCKNYKLGFMRPATKAGYHHMVIFLTKQKFSELSWLLSQAIGAIFTPVRNIHFYFTYILSIGKEKHSESEISQIFKFMHACMHAATFSWTEYQ